MHKILATLLIALVPGIALAACKSSLPTTTPSVLPPNYSGNAQTDSFNCALSGENELSIDQINERNALVPQKMSDRFYIRIGLNAASESLMSIKNKSPTTAVANATLTKGDVSTASNNIELAVGYVWNDFGIDLEWLGVKSIAYNAAVTGTSNFSINSVTKGDAILGNLYWIFEDLYNFKFYAVGTGGMSTNKTETTVGSGNQVTSNRFAPAFGGGIGMRFSVLSNIFADMGARYLFLGRARIEGSDGSGNFLSLSGTRTWLGLSLRVLWLL